MELDMILGEEEDYLSFTYHLEANQPLNWNFQSFNLNLLEYHTNTGKKGKYVKWK